MCHSLTIYRELGDLRGSLLYHSSMVDAPSEEALLGTEADCDLCKQLRELRKRICKIYHGD